MQNYQNRKKKGFTLAELMVVIGIIIILAGVVFVAVQKYYRVLKHMEYDSIAKEIFISAQNHLSMAFNEGYLERKKSGYKDDTDGVFYFVVKNADNDEVEDPDSLLNLMLPFGAIDETVRKGGSYIIRYDRENGQVLDVFYSDKNDSRFGHTFGLLPDDKYNGNSSFSLMNIRPGKDSDPHKDKRRNYIGYGESNISIIGYYGGEIANPEYGEKVETPYIRVDNAERLSVTVKIDTLREKEKLTLIVNGLKSNGKASFELKEKYDEEKDAYIVVLDDVAGTYDHFCNNPKFSSFIPGEDLEIYAVAANNEALTNVATSNKVKTNSIFGDNTDETKADISNIRHLENLDSTISKFNKDNFGSMTKADQSADLDWNMFKKYTNQSSTSIYNISKESVTGSGNYYPVNLPLKTYQGNSKSVSNISVNQSGDVGMFSTLVNKNIQDLQLIDFSVSSSSGNAGALAGSVRDSSVITNVLAREYELNNSTISAGGNAGGLVGSCNGSEINLCAAAMFVTGNDAGGLIGSVSSSTISSSYSGGHTIEGKYQLDSINVSSSSGNAGGLVGSVTSSTISNCYSTCSTDGSTSTGGLAGQCVSTDVNNSYAVGYVNADKNNKQNKGALIGADNGGSYSASRYLKSINSEIGAVGSGGKISGITAIDQNKAEYHSFITEYLNNTQMGITAKPYDDLLSDGSTIKEDEAKTRYRGRYLYQGIPDLLSSSEEAMNKYYVKEHYGDWAITETFVVNN